MACLWREGSLVYRARTNYRFKVSKICSCFCFLAIHGNFSQPGDGNLAYPCRALPPSALLSRPGWEWELRREGKSSYSSSLSLPFPYASVSLPPTALPLTRRQRGVKASLGTHFEWLTACAAHSMAKICVLSCVSSHLPG